MFSWNRHCSGSFGTVGAESPLCAGTASAWFADRGRTAAPTAGELECLCQGFAAQDSAAAVENALLWAR